MKCLFQCDYSCHVFYYQLSNACRASTALLLPSPTKPPPLTPSSAQARTSSSCQRLLPSNALSSWDNLTSLASLLSHPTDGCTAGTEGLEFPGLSTSERVQVVSAATSSQLYMWRPVTRVMPRAPSHVVTSRTPSGGQVFHSCGLTTGLGRQRTSLPEPLTQAALAQHAALQQLGRVGSKLNAPTGSRTPVACLGYTWWGREPHGLF